MRRGKHGSCRNEARRPLYVAPSQGLTGSVPLAPGGVGSDVSKRLRADEQLQSVGRRDHDRQRHDVWVVGVDHERFRAGPAMRPLLGDRSAVGASDGGGTHYLPVDPSYREFTRRREGMCFALDGGVWLHRHTLRGEPMVHLVSADKERLLALGPALALKPAWLQYKPLKDPRTGVRVPAWHWDVMGARLQRLETGTRLSAL